jgi:aconitase A
MAQASGGSGKLFAHLQSELNVKGNTYRFFDLRKLKDDRIQRLPYSIRVLLEVSDDAAATAVGV